MQPEIETRTSEQIARPIITQLQADFDRYSYAVVYFIQRRPDGPIKIGTTSNLLTRMSGFINASPDPVICRLAIPGSQALEHYFHQRNTSRLLVNEWYGEAEEIVEDAQRFREIQAAEFKTVELGDRIENATLAAVREHSSEMADLERLWRNHVTIKDIAALCGLTEIDVRRRLRNLQALGCPLDWRRLYGKRERARDPIQPNRGFVRLVG